MSFKATSMSHKNIVIIRPFVLVIVLGPFFMACDDKHVAQQTQTTTPSLPVDVVVAHQEALQLHETFVGSIVPYQEVSIVGEIAQKITKITFKDGDYVKSGTVLYYLNQAEINARLHQVSAQIELANLTKIRLENLLKTEAVKQQEYDEARAQLRSLEAEQELLNAELSKTVIRAPFSGRIGISKLHIGAYVVPGVELVTLQDMSMAKIKFSVPERYIRSIKIGNKIKFYTALSDKEYSAVVVATEPGLDESGRSLLIQAQLQNDGLLRAGISVKVLFNIADEITQGVQIPSEALVSGKDGYSVFIVKDGVAKSIAVRAGGRSETKATITSGIDTGDTVIVSNILRLGDGVRVQPLIAQTLH